MKPDDPAPGAPLVETLERLRGLYPAAKARALRKQIAALDPHARRFVGLSPFVVVASAGAAGSLDASPRGGAPGFVKAPDAATLLIPDAPGNNRLDTLENVVATGRVGLLFMIPGVDETLRVNGRARLSTAPAHVALCTDEKRAPRLVVEVGVEEVYLHCAKALMRSRLWSGSAQVDRAVLPTIGEMIHSQTGDATPPESQEAMLARYAADL